MSPAEYLELMTMSGDSAGLHGMNAISILFAYVVAAYFVGSKLSRYQLISINVLYSIFLTIPVIACIGAVSTGSIHAERFSIEHPDIAAQYAIFDGANPSNYYFYANSAVWLGAWMLSLLFMRNSRKAPLNVPIVT